GFWPRKQAANLSPDDMELHPRPTFLNRLVFFDVVGDSTSEHDRNYRANLAIRDLQGPHIPSSACAERPPIDDPLYDPKATTPPPPDVDPDRKIHGLRACQDGQWLDQRNPDTIFALEFFHAYEALSPLTEVFVKHQQEDLLLELLGVLHKHW